MNNKPYPHKEKPLTQSIAEKIISTETYTTGSSITTIAKHVNKKHVERGGLPAEKDLEDIVESALRYLSHSGKVNGISSNIWMIPRYSYQRIFGSGKHWVYLYYFSMDRKKAESNGEPFWPCKIEKIDKDPEKRVKDHLANWVPDLPHIALLLRVDKHHTLETAIHKTLTLRGRYPEKFHRKKWFLTYPREVEKIYRFIMCSKRPAVEDLKTIFNERQIFGSGKHWVYLYYFPHDKEKAKSNGEPFWPCKIGQVNENPEGRVRKQTLGVPALPHIALLLKVDKHLALETAIHKILTLRGRHLEKLPGKEWFLTNPDEVWEIYDVVMYDI